MTVYHFKCEKGHSFDKDVKMKDRNDTLCKCGSATTITFWEVTNKVGYTPFPEGIWEHLGPEPIYINDKRHLMEECKKRDKYAPFYMT